MYSQRMHTLLTTILKRYKLYPSNILALGDDELSWLSLWWSSHQIWGIVSNRDLVDTGKKTSPGVKLYAQKLESYRITGAMQLTYALHWQINTLDHKKWEKLFETVAKHSMPYGLMVFDINLSGYYDAQSKSGSQTTISPDTVILSSWTSKKGRYTHDQVEFVQTQTNENIYRKTQHTQEYHTMSLVDLKKIWSSYFETVTVLDIKWRKLSKAADHVLIVCQMWWPDWKPKAKS